MSPVHKASLIEVSYHSKEVLQLLDLDVNRTLVGELSYQTILDFKYSSSSFSVRPFGSGDCRSGRPRTRPTHHFPWQVRLALQKAPRLFRLYRERPIRRGREDAHHLGDSHLHPPLQTPSLNRDRRVGSPPCLPRSPHHRLQIHQ